MPSLRPLACALLALGSAAADFSKVDPTAFGADDPRTRELPGMTAADVRRRTADAGAREAKAFAAVTTRAGWEAYRDERLKALRASLGTFPPAPKDVRVVVTGSVPGDGFVIRNLVFESRPGWWVPANLYLPATPPARMPAVQIAHSHHGGKTGGELQDMGMTWARAGVAVLVPDQVGYGERREHGFRTDADHPKPFRAGRQDYYFRYASNLQLSAVGDGLMGWMVWDLMRGIDVLLQQPGIDPGRIILVGSVAGGGDPVGVTAALDPRVACAVPFNFGGWQPESRPTADPDREFAWFGDGYWESTRGLRGGAAGGFAHFVIAGAVAPRKLIYAHEFAWNAAADPAWPRLRKVFGLYDPDALRVAHGTGTLKGRPPESSHCDHVGAVHRKMLYPALRDWFGMPVPAEFSQRRPAADLRCWTDAARAELRPQTLAEVAGRLAKERAAAVGDTKTHWAARLGDIAPTDPKAAELKAEPIPGGRLARFALETDPGVTVPVFLLTPDGAAGKMPVVLMVAAGGKQAFLADRADAVAALLAGGAAVCLADVRGTGETRPGRSADRTSARTSVSQGNLILGTPVLGGQLRDLRAVARWLRTRPEIDGRLAVWGDSFAAANLPGVRVAVPLDAELPAFSEPGGANLALLAGLFEPGVAAVYARGGLAPDDTLTGGPFLYLPHDAVVPGPVPVGSLAPALARSKPVRYEGTVDPQNRAVGAPAADPRDAAGWVLERFRPGGVGRGLSSGGGSAMEGGAGARGEVFGEPVVVAQQRRWIAPLCAGPRATTGRGRVSPESDFWPVGPGSAWGSGWAGGAVRGSRVPRARPRVAAAATGPIWSESTSSSGPPPPSASRATMVPHGLAGSSTAANRSGVRSRVGLGGPAWRVGSPPEVAFLPTSYPTPDRHAKRVLRPDGAAHGISRLPRHAAGVILSVALRERPHGTASPHRFGLPAQASSPRRYLACLPSRTQFVGGPSLPWSPRSR